MALNDVKIVGPAGHTDPPSFQYRMEAGSTVANPGEPLKLGGTGGNYVVVLTDGEPEISADVVVGIAASLSDQTAGADGVVDVFSPLSGLIYRCDATTPANIDTDAELLLLLNDRVTFDLAAGVYTVDENEGDDADHGLRIIGGDIVNGTLDFFIRHSGTVLN